jgi:hypothetical protein
MEILTILIVFRSYSTNNWWVWGTLLGCLWLREILLCTQSLSSYHYLDILVKCVRMIWDSCDLVGNWWRYKRCKVEGGMGTYWTISQEQLLVSGQTKRRWEALHISFLLTSSSSDSACLFWRSMLSYDLLLLPLSVSDSGRFFYARNPSRLITIWIYSLNVSE